jgi:hypothetical protein
MNLIPLPRGRQLVTLKDAAEYIQKLPKAEQLRAMLEAGMKTPAIALKLRRTVSAVRTRKDVLNNREARLKAKAK